MSAALETTHPPMGLSTRGLTWLAKHLEDFARCPLCCGSREKLLCQVGILRVRRCADCGMMFLNPYLKPAQMKKIFSSPELLRQVSRFCADYYESTKWKTSKTLSIYQSVLREIGSFSSSPGKLMDIGCGKGTFLELAKEKGWQACGVEPNFDDAKRLRDKGIEIYQNDFLEVSLPANEFDVISLWDLIEHVPDPREWVRRCAKTLRGQGLLVIATPNHFSFLDFLAHLACRLSFGTFTYALEKLYTVDHTLYFTHKTLRSLLEREGFVILKTMKVNTDLSRYTMSAAFRFFAEGLLALSSLFNSENRVIMIARKK